MELLPFITTYTIQWLDSEDDDMLSNMVREGHLTREVLNKSLSCKTSIFINS